MDFIASPQTDKGHGSAEPETGPEMAKTEERIESDVTGMLVNF